MNLTHTGLGAVIFILLLPFCRLYVSRRRYYLEAKRRGCGFLPDAQGMGPLGIFGMFQLFEAVYRYNVLSDDFIFTRDPKNFKAMFVGQVDEFDHSDSWMGAGLVNNRGEQWKRSRLLLQPQFSRSIISDLEVLEQHLEDEWRLLDESLVRRWTPVIDFSHIFTNLTLGTSTEMLLGQRVNLQQPQVADAAGSNAKAVELRQHYHVGSALIYIKLLFGKKNWMIPIPRTSYHYGKIREYLRSFIDDALNLDDGKNDYVLESKDKFVFLRELIKSTRDAVEVENEILGVLSAGVGTTATLLTWALYLFARNPEVFEKVRTLVLSRFGSTPNNITLKGLAPSHSGDPTLGGYSTNPVPF